MATARDYGLGDEAIVLVRAARDAGDKELEQRGLSLVARIQESADKGTPIFDAPAQFEEAGQLGDEFKRRFGANPLDIPYSTPFMDDVGNAYVSGHPVAATKDLIDHAKKALTDGLKKAASFLEALLLVALFGGVLFLVGKR